MADSIGKRLADELKQRANVHAKKEQEVAEHLRQQKSSDASALASLAQRVHDEVDDFNANVGTLTQLAFSPANGSTPDTLTSARTVSFSIQGGTLQITMAPSGAPVLSTVVQNAYGYTYRHLGHNGAATNRESTEDEVVAGLLRQACGL